LMIESLLIAGLTVNPRSGCQHKALGRAQRNPRNRPNSTNQARGASDSRRHIDADRSIGSCCVLDPLATARGSATLSPASRAQSSLVASILGLTPEASCLRALRALTRSLMLRTLTQSLPSGRGEHPVATAPGSDLMLSGLNLFVKFWFGGAP
jgi:hypothetical protein